MVEVPVPQKPIPQYTIRWMLGLMTGCGVVFSIVALAMRGHNWALAISIGVGALVLFMTVGALLFSVVWIFSPLISKKSPPSRGGRSTFGSANRNPPPDFLSDGE
jgi:hypothetical protein